MTYFGMPVSLCPHGDGASARSPAAEPAVSVGALNIHADVETYTIREKFGTEILSSGTLWRSMNRDGLRG